MTFEEVYQQIRKMHYEILDILTEYRDEWCDDCKRFNTVIRETLNREPSEDGTLEVKVEDATKVGRVLISDDKHRGGLYYPDEDEPQGDLISRAEAAEIFEAMLKTVTDQKIKIGISRLWQQIKDLPSADRPRGRRPYQQSGSDRSTGRRTAGMVRRRIRNSRTQPMERRR